MYEFLPFVIVPHIHFGKAETAYHHHGLASCSSARCSYTLESYIYLRVIIYEFSLCISMNYTENVAELLAHAPTVDTMCSYFF